jgi:subtilase family serine protease
LHYFATGGSKHPALVQEPMIPAALSPVITGIQGLNKIPAHPSHTAARPAAYDTDTHRWHNGDVAEGAKVEPDYADASGNFDVTPQDFYTIYDVNPTFKAGVTGTNSAVAVIEESDIQYGTVNASTHAATGGDVANFRKIFGVPGTLNMHVYHGYGTVACNDPGVDPNGNNEQQEAALDAEWASALAPAANFIYMSCDQSPNMGIITSMMALIDNNLSDVMSLSYGRTEHEFSSSDYSSQDTLYAQAAAQGQSFIVSSGDSGSDTEDQNTSGTAVSGINVSGFGSPLVTVAGGTDYQDLYDALAGGAAQSAYWSAANTSTYGNALGYVPETAWNPSCASSLIAKLNGYSGAGLCGAGPGSTDRIDGEVAGGAGGLSTHYANGAYQAGITGFAGTKRAQPDISSFAAGGYLGHSLIFCDSTNSYSACTSSTSFAAAGGTSFVAPQFAGVGGLLVNYTGSRQGQLNPGLYSLAKAQFTAAGTKTACYANGQTANTGVTTARPAASCIFNDVTTSNNDVPCSAASTNCYVDAGASYGMLSLTGAASLTVAYPSTVGYDEATGIGSLNVNNLLMNWGKAYTTTTGLAASATSITTSQSTVLTATVKGAAPSGFSGKLPILAGSVSFTSAGNNLGNCTLSTAGTCTLSVLGSALTSGANSITSTFAGSKSYPASTSTAVSVTVAAGAEAVALSASSLSFGTEAVGTQTAAKTIIVTNKGTSALTISSISVGGTSANSFSITAETCTASLAVSGTCTFSVDFKPAVAGALAASISVVDGAGTQAVSLSGTGSSTTSALSVSPASLGFGSETKGSFSVSQMVTIKNVSASALTLSSLGPVGTGATSFGQLNTCYVTLAAGASCYALVDFAPQATGSIAASYTVTATTASGSVALSGTGIATATLTFSASSVAFGTVTHGLHSAATILTVTNTGTTAATFSLIGIGGTNGTSFSQLDTCGPSLAAGAKCSVFVEFVPAAAGSYSGLLELFDNAQFGYQQITLTGTGS